MGLDEVAKLLIGLTKAAEKLGHKNLTRNEIFQKIKNEKSQQFSSKDEILPFFLNVIDKINPKVIKLFGPGVARPEILQMVVNEAGPGAALATYSIVSVDGKRTGSFNIDLTNIDTWRKYLAISLALHEGNPGHNLQVCFFFFLECHFNLLPNFLLNKCKRTDGVNH